MSGFNFGMPETADVEITSAGLAGLLDEFEAAFRRHLVFTTDHEAPTLALWTAFTYVHEQFDCCPYIVVKSPQKRCGKTLLLEVLEKLTNRPVLGGNMSSPTLFRLIDEHAPTLLIDEADAFIAQDPELIGLLNTGHRRAAAWAHRCVGEGTNMTTKAFSTWCPKVIAGIGKLKDTLEDRAIPIQMRRKLTTEKVERLRYADYDDLRSIALNLATVDMPISEPTYPTGLSDRAMDIWEPLLQIARLAGAAWEEKSQLACKALSTVTPDDDSIDVLLLTDVRAAFIQYEDDRITSQVLLDALLANDERPWADWNHGKGLTKNTLARRLKPYYGTRTGTVQMRRGDNAKGYKLKHFNDAFSRYLPPGGETNRQDVKSQQPRGFAADTKRQAENAHLQNVNPQPTGHADLDGLTVDIPPGGIKADMETF